MYEYFVPYYNNANDLIRTYTQSFNLYSEVTTDSGSIDYIRFQIKDTIPAVTLNYSTEPKNKVYNSWHGYDGYRGEMTIHLFIEVFTLAQIKYIIKLVQKSHFPQEKAEELSYCIDIQVQCYIWYLNTINKVKNDLKCLYLSKHLTEKKYNAQIKVLKRTFDRYKRLKDRAINIRDEFERVANNV